jgi:hypothetical protein
VIKHQQHDSLDDSGRTSKININNHQETSIQTIKNNDSIETSTNQNTDMRVVDDSHQAKYKMVQYNTDSIHNKSQIVFQKVKQCKE